MTNNKKTPAIRFKGFTDTWELRKLRELAEIKDSARIPNAEWSDFGVPYIRASDITNKDASGVLFISNERYEFYKNKTGAPAKGDVLFNGGGEIGKTMLYQINLVLLCLKHHFILPKSVAHLKKILICLIMQVARRVMVI